MKLLVKFWVEGEGCYGHGGGWFVINFLKGMAFNDINQIRETETKNYVVFNDFEKEVSKDVIRFC